MIDQEIRKSRLEFIQKVMDGQGTQGQPKRYVVLRDWNQIVDWDMTYEIQTPPIPPVPWLVGKRVWVPASSDSPALVDVLVVEDSQAGAFVKSNEHPVQWLVPRDLVRQTPIPLRPLAVLRRDLKLYLGETVARDWHENRRKRLIQWMSH